MASVYTIILYHQATMYNPFPAKYMYMQYDYHVENHRRAGFQQEPIFAKSSRQGQKEPPLEMQV